MPFTATWKGEEATPDLNATTRWGIVFEKGKVVEIKDKKIAVKLSANPNFETQGRPEDIVDGDPLLHPAPSTVSALGPVPKPGEPVREPEAPPEPGPKEDKPITNKLKMPPAPPPGIKKV
jgi:hypothetical protein